MDSKSNKRGLFERLAFYWETVRRLGPGRFAGEAYRKLGGEFRYRRFISFAQDAPEDYSPGLALKRMGRSDLGRVREDIRRFPLFFLDEANRDSYRICLEDQGCLQGLLADADRISEGIWPVFGHEIRWDGDDFDWHSDPLSGYKWEKDARLYLREKMGSEVVVAGRGDVRVTWEISRLGCMVRLGQAWWLTGREEYAQALVKILEHWLEHNRPYRGVNWSSAMEVAIRAVNVIWALFLAKDSPLFTDELVGKVLSFLALSREFILGLMEWYFEASGNHYISNLVGLLYIDLLFPGLSQHSRVDFAIGELAREAECQVYPDGVHFESSTAYHGLVLEMFLSSAILCRENGRRIPESFLKTIAGMAGFIRDALPPSARMLQIGDNDSGRLLDMREDSPLDHSRWCDLAGVITDNPILGCGSSPEILWYLGPESYKKYLKNIPASRPVVSAAFPDGGYYFMRSVDGYMGIVCGPNGIYGRGCHAHNDKLSFELWYRGERYLTDPGCCAYSGDPRLRDLFRSTAFHNTVRVDGEEQNSFVDNLFLLGNDAKAEVLVWETNEEYDFFSGVHYGYRRLSHPVTHRRDIRFDKKRICWKITDFFQGENTHHLEWNFHIDPEVGVEIEGAKTVRLTGKKSSLLIQFEEPAELDIKEGLFSPGYRQQQPSKIVRLQKTIDLPYRISFELNGG